MKKIKISFIILICLALTKVYAQQNSYNGKYINNDGAILTITNFINNQGFNFTYDDNTKGKPCSSQSWEGKAKLNSEKEATLLNDSGEETEITFSLEGENITFNIDMNIFGIECQKFFSRDFEKNVDTKVQLPLIKTTMGDYKYIDWGTSAPESDMVPPEPWSWTHIMCYGPAKQNVKASTTLPPQGKFKYLANA